MSARGASQAGCVAHRPALATIARHEQALPLFAYGTLTDRRLLRRVIGSHGGRAVRAWLPGYAVHAVRGQPFPALVADARASATGLLWGPLPAAAWPRLDRYEGHWYRRIPAEVLPEGGRTTTAWVYLWNGPRRLLAGRWPARARHPGGTRP